MFTAANAVGQRRVTQIDVAQVHQRTVARENWQMQGREPHSGAQFRTFEKTRNSAEAPNVGNRVGFLGFQ
jgi:hypothetical protein